LFPALCIDAWRQKHFREKIRFDSNPGLETVSFAVRDAMASVANRKRALAQKANRA
jgi:hypothetical protein